ncbi:centromere protein N [Genypterus blacodes]|uniref:centromere protein N n=1 Tax=Genypterus blacodes TaxID=154954 RepID=UPI003F77168D
MEDTAKRLLRRLIRRSPAQQLRAALEKWSRLTAAQRREVEGAESKQELTERLMMIQEEQVWSLKQVTELEMIYVIDNPNQGMWQVLQLTEPSDDVPTVELTQFKENFRSHLSELIRHVSVKMKKASDEAVWIRIAWGDGFSRPNHLRPTYVLHYLQTPYVFVSSLTSKQRPLLSQALALATRYGAVKDANLSGRKLTALRDLLMKRYQQTFPSVVPGPVTEKNQTLLHPQVERDQAEAAVERQQKACEAFGEGTLPQLQTAVYKLETKFRDHSNKKMSESDGPFRCVVKFASTNLLESLRDCASSGFASTPVAPLLSSITLKGRNHFVITDNGPGPSHS